MSKEDIKDIIKWVLIAVCGLGGGSHVKDFSVELFSPMIEETKLIRINQGRMIYNQLVDQFMADGLSLDESIEKANEQEHE